MNTPFEIKKPAIGLLVGGIILAVLALATIILLESILPQSNMFTSGDDRMKIGLLRAGGFILGMALLAMSVFAVLGALSMMKGRGHGMAMTGAICSIVGAVFSGLPGWILVLPLGIWAVVTLRRPDVKALLKRGSTHPQTPS